MEMDDRDEIHIPMDEEEEMSVEDEVVNNDSMDVVPISHDNMVRELEPELEQEQNDSDMVVEQPVHTPELSEEPQPLVAPVVETPLVRRSSRAVKPRNFFHEDEKYFPKVLHISVRKGLQQYGGKARESIMTELQQMVQKKVFTPVDISTLSSEQKQKAIRSSMFLKEKFTPTGEFLKLKSRLVAGGDQQDRALYDDVSSPTASTTSLFAVLTIAAAERRHVATMDIAGAYLNASMSSVVVHMYLDPVLSSMLCELVPEYKIYLLKDGRLMVKLDKALYGCIESAKLWYEHLKKSLEELGFRANPEEPCCFNHGVGADQCTIIVFVDDLLVTCRNMDIINDLISKLKAKYHEVQEHTGVHHSYLGMSIDMSKDGICVLTMPMFVAEVIKDVPVGSAVSPAGGTLYIQNENSELLAESDRKIFHSMVAKLLYLGKRVRGDILTAVAYLTTRVTKATKEDQSKLLRVLKYLRDTKEMGHVLDGRDGIELQVFADASHAVHTDAKGQSGAVERLGKAAIYFSSTKQKVISRSSFESELNSLHEIIPHVMGTRRFLIAQGYNVGPVKVWQDNMSTIAFVKKGGTTSHRTKHIAVRYHFLKEKIDEGEIAVEYLPTLQMLADMFTKPLQGELFRMMRSKLLGWDTVAEEP